MLNMEKIRLMTDLARFESKIGKEDLRLGRYYRSDYLGKGLLANFFLTSIGYVLVMLLVLFYFADYLLDHILDMNLSYLTALLLGGYVIMLVVYSVIVYVKRSLRYSRARRALKQYDEKLGALEKIYDREEKKKGR